MHFILAGVFLFLQFSGIIKYCKNIEINQGGFEKTLGPKDEDDKKKALTTKVENLQAKFRDLWSKLVPSTVMMLCSFKAPKLGEIEKITGDGTYSNENEELKDAAFS